jgi:hypothetical protein
MMSDDKQRTWKVSIKDSKIFTYPIGYKLPINMFNGIII